jgi:hypothetical protein
MSDLFQWAIVAFIVLSILYHVFRGGAANPESTGSLGGKVNGLSSQVSALSGRTAQQVSALSERVGQVEEKMKSLSEAAATTKDVEQLEKLVDERCNTIRAEIEGHKGLSQATNNSVQRIERMLIEKGLNK